MMRHPFLMLSVLSSFIGQNYASEYGDEIGDKAIFAVGLQEVAPKLRYISPKKIAAIKKYFPDIKDNEPFFTVSKYVNNSRQVACLDHAACVIGENKIKNSYDAVQKDVLYLPLRYFVLEKENKFKSHNVELCSYKANFSETYFGIDLDHKYNVEIQLKSSMLNQYAPATLIDIFRNCPYHLPEDKQELIDAGIIDEEGGHGPNSYFADEIKTALFYSRLRKFCIGGLAVILIYVLYKKLYTTS